MTMVLGESNDVDAVADAASHRRCVLLQVGTANIGCSFPKHVPVSVLKTVLERLKIRSWMMKGVPNLHEIYAEHLSLMNDYLL